MIRKLWFSLFLSLCLLFCGCVKIKHDQLKPAAWRNELCYAMTDRCELLQISSVYHLSAVVESKVEPPQVTDHFLSTSTPLMPEPQQAFSPVKLILQNPELPNGCEVTCLAMLLSAAGFPIGHVDLYRNYLPTDGFSHFSGQRFGPSPEEVYVGDASSRDGGWYCFENPLVEAGNAWIQQNDGGSRMKVISGISQEDLEQYTQNGIPVITWVTLGYGRPDYANNFSWNLPSGESYVPYSNLHCVLLTGEENDRYRIADPINGMQLVSKEVFWNSFDAMGRRAVTMEVNG